MIVWKDTTSYSRSDKERVPRTWEADLPGVRLIVTKHRDYGDEWTTSCYPLYNEVCGLQTTDVEEAKKKALERFVYESSQVVMARERVKMALAVERRNQEAT